MKLSPPVVNVLLKSISAGTLKQYEMYLRKYIVFSDQKCVEFGNVTTQLCLEFLNDLFVNGSSYVSLNCARSALSFAFGHKVSLGNDPVISRFMKGVYQLRTPRAKYEVTWNVDSLLGILEKWDSATISLKDLTLKTVSILALATGQRVQSLASIRLNEIVFDDNQVQIIQSAKLKTTSINRMNPVLVLPKFSNPSLCPYTSLKTYLDKTKNIRSLDCDRLFISYVKPYNIVTSHTVSRWLSGMLDKAGIDTKIYSAHSYRHASCSKASINGVNVDTIFKRVGWTSNSRVFATYYNRPIEERSSFAKTVLSKL